MIKFTKYIYIIHNVNLALAEDRNSLSAKCYIYGLVNFPVVNSGFLITK